MKTKKEKSIKKFQLDKIVISSLNTKKLKGGACGSWRTCGFSICC